MECSKCGYIYNGVENISNCPKCGQNFGLKEEEGLSKKSKAAVAVGAAAGAVAGIANLAAKEGKIFASSKSDKKSQAEYEKEEEIFSDTKNESNQNADSNINQDSQAVENATGSADGSESSTGNSDSNADDGIDFGDEPTSTVPTPGNGGNDNKPDTPSNDEGKNDDSSNENTPSNDEGKNGDSSNEDTPSNDEGKNDDSSNEDTPSNDEGKNDDSIDEDTPSNDEGKNDDSIDEDTPSNDEGKNEDSIDEDTPSNDSNKDDDSVNENTPGSGGGNNNETEPTTPSTPNTTTPSTERNMESSGGGNSGGGGIPDIKTDLSDVESVLAMLGSNKSLMSVSSGKGFGDVYQANGSEYSDIVGVLDAVVDKSAALSKYVSPFPASAAQKVKAAVGGGGASGYASELAGKVENLKGLLGKLYGGNYELAYNLEMQGKLYTTDPTTGEPVATQALLDLQNLGINTSTLDEDVYSFTAGYFEDEANKIKSGDMSYKDSYLYKSMNDPTLTAEDIIKHYRDFTDQISASMVMLGTAGILSMTTTYGDTDTTLSQFVNTNVYDGINDKNKSDSQRYLETLMMKDVTSKNPGSMTSDDKKFLNTMNQHTENIREEYKDAQEDAARQNALNGTRAGGPQMVAYDGDIAVDAALQAEYDHVFNLTAIAANNLCFTTTVSDVISARDMTTDRVFKGAEERTIEVNGRICTVPARDELANQYCDLYLDMMGNTSTQRLEQGGLTAENFYLQHQLNDVAIPNWDKANEEYLDLYKNGYEGLADKFGITDLNSLKSIDQKAYNTLKSNETLFDEAGNLLPGLNSDDIALAYAKYNAEQELNVYNDVTADMIVFSNFASEIDKGNQAALSAYTKYMDNSNMTWEDMTLNGRIEIPSVIDANKLNDQLIENEANRLDTLTSYEDVYRGAIQKEITLNEEQKNDNLWSRIGIALQQSSVAQNGGLTPSAVEMQLEQSNALAEQQMELAGQSNDLTERNNALNNIVTATNIRIEEIGHKLNVELIQGYSDYAELAVPKYLPTNTLNLEEIEAAVKANMPQGKLSDKEYEQLVSDTADYQLALNIIEQEKNGKNVNLLFYSKDVRNYVENLYYYENNRSAEDLQKMIGAMNYSFNKAYESGNTAYAFQTFNNKFNTLNESGFQLEAQARAEWILTNQAGEIKNKFMESFMDYESMGMTDAFGMTAALLSVAEEVEHIVDTTVVPLCFGVQSFGRGLINAVTNTIEYIAVDLGVGDFYSDLFEKVPGLEYMPGMQVGHFLANYDPPKHTTSMGDAIFGYMSSAVNSGEYGFNKLDSISMQAFQSIGNMAIPMIVSGVCQPLGSALLFTSAYGNTFEQSRIDGMNPHAALAYSIMSAGTEMVMERVLGGMPNMGKAASAVGKAGFVKSMFSEAKEEMLQEFIDPFLEDVAYALFPQRDAEGKIKDEGLRNVFGLDYWEHYIKEDFDPEAIAMAGVVAMFSAGVTNSGKLKTAIKSEMKYGTDIALGNQAEVYNNIKAKGYTDVQTANVVNALYNELGNLSKTIDIKLDIETKISDIDLAQRKLDMNQEFELNKLDNNNKILNEAKIEKAKDIESKYKDLSKKIKEVEFDVDDKKQRKELKEAVEMLDPDRSEVTDADIKFQLYMEQMAKTIPNLETLLAQTDAEIPKFKNMLLGDLEKEERQSIQEQLNALEAKRTEIIKDIKSLKTKLNGELEANKAEIDKLSQEALDIQEKLKTETDNDVRTQLENELSQKMTAIDELQNANAQVNTKLGETTIPDLENRIKSLNEELAKLNEQESKFDENTPTEVRQELETERTRIQNEINQSSKRLVNALQDANNRMIEGLNEINNRNNNNNNDNDNDNNTDGTSNVDGVKPNMPRVEKLEEGVVRTITENQRKIKELEKQGIHPNGSPVKMSPATREVVNNVNTMNNILDAGTDLLNNSPSPDTTTTNPVSTASVGTSTNQVAANVDTMNNIVGTGNAIVGVASGGATVGALIGGIKSGILDLETKIKNFDKNGNNLNENPDGTRDTRTRRELKKELHEKRQMLGKIENSLHEYSMTENSPLKEFLDQMNSEIRDMELGKFDSEKVAEAYEINITTMSDKTAAQLKAQVTEFIKAINSINYSNMTFDQKLNEKFTDVQTLFDTLMNKIDFTESLSAVESIIKTLDIDATSQATINTKLSELTDALTGLETNIREYNTSFDSSKLTEIKKAFNTINIQIEGLNTELSNSLSVLSNNYGNLAVNIETSGVSAMTAENIKSISDLLGVVYENINGTYSYFDSLTKLTEISDMSKNHLKYMNVFKVSNEFNEMVNKFKNGDIDFDEFKVKLNNFSSGFNTVMNTYYSIDSTAFETVEPNTIVKNQTSIKDVFSSITTRNLSEAFELLKNQIGTIFVDSDAKKFEFITGLNELEKDFKHLLENTSTESVNTSNVTELKAKLDGIVNSLTKHINNNSSNIKVTEVNGTLVVETSNNIDGIDTKVVENIETATEQVAETVTEQVTEKTTEEVTGIEQLDTNNLENNISELEINTSSSMEEMTGLDIPNFEDVDTSIEEMSVPEVEMSQNIESVENMESSVETIKIDSGNFSGHFGEMIADGSLLYHPWDVKLDALKKTNGFKDVSNAFKLSAIAALNECHQKMSQGMTEAELMKLFNETSLRDVISLDEFADAMIIAPNQQLDANIYNEITSGKVETSAVVQQNAETINIDDIELVTVEQVPIENPKDKLATIESLYSNRNNNGQIDLDAAEKAGEIFIDRVPMRDLSGYSKKNLIEAKDGFAIFKKTTDGTYESVGELLGYHFASNIDLSAAKYDLATFDGQTGVISLDFIPANSEFVNGREILNDSVLYISSIQRAYESIMEQYKGPNDADAMRATIFSLTELHNNLKGLPSEFTEFVNGIDLETADDIALNGIMEKFMGYYTEILKNNNQILENIQNNKMTVKDLLSIMDIYSSVSGVNFENQTKFIEDIAKMTIFDMITSPSTRSFTDMGVIFDKTANAFKFAPIYDNSSLCGLDIDAKDIASKLETSTDGTLSQERLTQLDELLNANPEIKDVVKNVCGKFNSESINKVFETIENQYNIKLSEDVKTLVTQTIKANVEQISNHIDGNNLNVQEATEVKVIKPTETSKVPNGAKAQLALEQMSELEMIQTIFNMGRFAGFKNAITSGRINQNVLENLISLYKNTELYNECCEQAETNLYISEGEFSPNLSRMIIGLINDYNSIIKSTNETDINGRYHTELRYLYENLLSTDTIPVTSIITLLRYGLEYDGNDYIGSFVEQVYANRISSDSSISINDQLHKLFTDDLNARKQMIDAKNQKISSEQVRSIIEEIQNDYEGYIKKITESSSSDIKNLTVDQLKELISELSSRQIAKLCELGQFDTKINAAFEALINEDVISHTKISNIMKSLARRINKMDSDNNVREDAINILKAIYNLGIDGDGKNSERLRSQIELEIQLSRANISQTYSMIKKTYLGLIYSENVGNWDFINHLSKKNQVLYMAADAIADAKESFILKNPTHKYSIDGSNNITLYEVSDMMAKLYSAKIQKVFDMLPDNGFKKLLKATPIKLFGKSDQGNLAAGIRYSDPLFMSAADANSSRIHIYKECMTLETVKSIKNTICHEMAHVIDSKIDSGWWSGTNGVWEKIVKTERALYAGKSVTGYGKKFLTEDFAESMKLYLDNPKSFARKYPLRAMQIENILNAIDDNGNIGEFNDVNPTLVKFTPTRYAIVDANSGKVISQLTRNLLRFTIDSNTATIQKLIDNGITGKVKELNIKIEHKDKLTTLWDKVKGTFKKDESNIGVQETNTTVEEVDIDTEDINYTELEAEVFNKDELIQSIRTIVINSYANLDVKFDNIKRIIADTATAYDMSISEILTDDVLSTIQSLYGENTDISFIKTLLEIASDTNVSKIKRDLMSKITPDMTEMERIRLLYTELGKKLDYSEQYKYNTKNPKKTYEGYKSIYEAKKTIESLVNDDQIICVHWAQVYAESLIDAGIPKENIFVLRIKENGDYGFNTHAGMIVKLSDGSYIMPDVTAPFNGMMDLMAIKMGIPTNGFVHFDKSDVNEIISQTRNNPQYELSNGYEYVIEEPSVYGTQGEQINLDSESVDKIFLDRIGYHLFAFEETKMAAEARKKFQDEYMKLTSEQKTPENIQRLVEDIFGRNVFDKPIDSKIIEVLDKADRNGKYGSVKSALQAGEGEFFNKYLYKNEAKINETDLKLEEAHKLSDYKFDTSAITMDELHEILKMNPIDVSILETIPGWNPTTGEITSDFLNLNKLNTKNMINVNIYIKQMVKLFKDIKTANLGNIDIRYIPGDGTSKIVLTDKVSGRNYDCYYDATQQSIVIKETAKSLIMFSQSEQTYTISNISEFSINDMINMVKPELKTFIYEGKTITAKELQRLIALQNGNLKKDKNVLAQLQDIERQAKEIAASKGMTLSEYGAQRSKDSLFTPEQQAEINKLAENVRSRAEKAEPQITEDMKKLQVNGAYLTGLAHRLKSTSSLSRKIESDSVSRDGKSIKQDINVSASEIGDSVRYTLILSEKNYTKCVEASLKELEEKGYKVKKVKNFWGSEIYQGINTSIESPDGVVFELQFHTELSFTTKEHLNHEYYEVSRSLFTSPEASILSDEYMKITQSNVVKPNGVQNIETVNYIHLNNLNEYDLNKMHGIEKPEQTVFIHEGKKISFEEYSMIIAFRDGNLKSNPEIFEQLKELDAELRSIAESQKMSLKKYGAQRPDNNLFTSEQKVEIHNLASNVRSKAEKAEPQITKDMKKFETDGAYLTGLAHRLKSLDSLERKIESDSVSKDGKSIIQDINVSSSEIGDSVRYTLILNESNYTESVKKNLAELESKGYKIKKVKNFWGNPIYQGINTSIESPDGVVFELQFHTELSFITKEKMNHEYYEVSRSISENVSKEAKMLADEIMTITQSNVVIPQDIDSIKTMTYIEVKNIMDYNTEKLSGIKHPSQTTFVYEGQKLTFEEFKTKVESLTSTLLNESTMQEQGIGELTEVEIIEDLADTLRPGELTVDEIQEAVDNTQNPENVTESNVVNEVRNSRLANNAVIDVIDIIDESYFGQRLNNGTLYYTTNRQYVDNLMDAIVRSNDIDQNYKNQLLNILQDCKNIKTENEFIAIYYNSPLRNIIDFNTFKSLMLPMGNQTAAIPVITKNVFDGLVLVNRGHSYEFELTIDGRTEKYTASNLESLLKKYDIKYQKYILSNLSQYQQNEYFSRIKGMQLKNEILSTTNGLSNRVEIARKLYVELSKRVTYDASYAANTHSASSVETYNSVVSFENLTSTNVICKGWSDLYYELLMEAGFHENDVQIVPNGYSLGGHKWVVVDLHNGTSLIADAADSISGGSDMSHAKYSGKTYGFAVLPNKYKYARLVKIFRGEYGDEGIDIYKKAMEDVRQIDTNIGYAPKGQYYQEIMKKASEMFKYRNISDAEIAANVERLFTQGYDQTLTGIDIYVYFKMISQNIPEYMIIPDFKNFNYNGKDDAVAIIECTKTQKIMIYSHITGHRVFNSYNEFVDFKRKYGLWF